jgi:hypothetical protein
VPAQGVNKDRKKLRIRAKNTILSNFYWPLFQRIFASLVWLATGSGQALISVFRVKYQRLQDASTTPLAPPFPVRCYRTSETAESKGASKALSRA